MPIAYGIFISTISQRLLMHLIISDPDTFPYPAMHDLVNIMENMMICLHVKYLKENTKMIST